VEVGGARLERAAFAPFAAFAAFAAIPLMWRRGQSWVCFRVEVIT
jgi:hypothetical protein